jgi:hypothetical protein
MWPFFATWSLMLCGDHRDGAGLARVSPVHMEGRPGTAFLVFPDAIGIFAGVAVRRHVGDAGAVAADVDRDEAQRAAHGGIGAPAVPEDVLPAVDVQLVANRSVHDQQMGTRVGGRLATVEVVLRLHHRFDSCDDHRQILRPAARHHRVDRDLLHGGGTVARGNDPDHVVGLAIGVAQRLAHSGGGWRIDGQTVRPSLLAAIVEEREDALDRILDRELACFLRAVVHGDSSPERSFGNIIH